MEISVSKAKAHLTDLVRRAEEGEDIVLTRHGQPAARVVPIRRPLIRPEDRRAFLEEISRRGKAMATPGPSAARSQDFLYDDDGLPG